MAFSGAVVELSGDGAALSLRELLHRRSFGKVLTDQTIGVLVGPSLPGTVGRGEVDRHAGGLLNGPVPMKLGPVVHSDGLEPRAMPAQEMNHSFVQNCDGVVGKFSDERGSAHTLDQRHHAVIASLSMDGIHLPMAELLAQLHSGRTLGNMPLSP